MIKCIFRQLHHTMLMAVHSMLFGNMFEHILTLHASVILASKSFLTLEYLSTNARYSSSEQSANETLPNVNKTLEQCVKMVMQLQHLDTYGSFNEQFFMTILS